MKNDIIPDSQTELRLIAEGVNIHDDMATANHRKITAELLKRSAVGGFNLETDHTGADGTGPNRRNNKSGGKPQK